MSGSSRPPHTIRHAPGRTCHLYSHCSAAAGCVPATAMQTRPTTSGCSQHHHLIDLSVKKKKARGRAGLIHSWPSNSTTTMVHGARSMCCCVSSYSAVQGNNLPYVRGCACVCRRKIMHAAVRRRDRMHACSAVQGQETRVQTEYVVLHRLHPVSSSSSSCLRVSSHPPPEFEAGCS